MTDRTKTLLQEVIDTQKLDRRLFTALAEKDLAAFDILLGLGASANTAGTSQLSPAEIIFSGGKLPSVKFTVEELLQVVETLAKHKYDFNRKIDQHFVPLDILFKEYLPYLSPLVTAMVKQGAELDYYLGKDITVKQKHPEHAASFLEAVKEGLSSEQSLEEWTRGVVLDKRQSAQGSWAAMVQNATSRCYGHG